MGTPIPIAIETKLLAVASELEAIARDLLRTDSASHIAGLIWRLQADVRERADDGLADGLCPPDDFTVIEAADDASKAIAGDAMEPLVMIALLATPFALLGALVAFLIVQIGSETTGHGARR